MMLNQDNTPPIPPPKVCGNCRIDSQWILHNIRHRGIFRRICTSCVLRLHPHSFCPSCFTVYQSSQPPIAPNSVVTCVKCYSVSHSSCVGGNTQSRYLCPMCVNRNIPVLVTKKESDDRVIDGRVAKILVAAARISSGNMREAEMAAKAVAERRAKEAAITRKRATQALDYMAAIAVNGNMKMNESMPRVVGNVGKRLTGRGDGCGYSGPGNGKGNGVVIDRRSNEVLTRALNGVELKENRRLGGVGLRASGVSNGVAMVVDERRVLSSGCLEVGDLAVQDHDGIVQNESSGDRSKLHDENTRRESVNVNNGVVRNPPKEDWMEGVENSNLRLQGVKSTDPGKNRNGFQQ